MLTVRGVFTKQLSARWAIVQLAGRRILVPLIVVQVHVAQPTRTQTSPSSSRPRTAAFHAVNSGSNPLGDANRHQRLSFFLLLGRKGDMPRVPFLFKATENIQHTLGSSLSPFLYRKESAVKPSPCVATHIGRPAMRRPRPNLHPQAARLLGIRLVYAPPYRHVPHVPARPLVIRSSLRFPGAMRYCADMRRNLRRRIIMDIAQLLSGLALIPRSHFLPASS